MSTYEQKLLKKDPDGSDNFVTAKTLSTSFVDVTGASYFIDCAGWDEMTIYAFYHADNTGEVLTTRVDLSPNQTDWCPEADETIVASLATQKPKLRGYTALTADEEAVPVISIPLNDRWARVMAKNSANTGILRLLIVLSKVGS